MRFDFHHFGIACKDLDREQAQYELLGYEPEGADFSDAVQGIRGRFLVGGGPRLELLVALPGSTVLDPWLQAGHRIYQQAFEVDDLAEAIEFLEGKGARTVVEPVPAVAFEGRQIAFLMQRNMAMIELIEAPR